MSTVVVVIALVAIYAQLFRQNSLLQGIFLILERHHRPEGAQPEHWVTKLHDEAKERRPPVLLPLIINLSLLAGVVALLIWLWNYVEA